MNTANIAQNGKEGSKSGTAVDVGRFLLNEWASSRPDNFFSSDVNFQRILEFHWGREKYRQLASRFYRFGGLLATIVDPAVREANLDVNLPRLERFDAFGGATEDVLFHPSHHEAGRLIYGSEMLTVYEEPGNNLLSLGLFYLSSQNGEAGHNCPVACTAGLIKVLQATGETELQDKYLPRLLDSNYESHFHGAQFLTEVQGGSDVGANAMVATPLDDADGIWLLNGEKWFCSNVTADLALVTARVVGQGKGTRGLGLFLVPRRLDDGLLNRVAIRRLKDKVGTRSMATAELEFDEAIAYHIGPTENGFKNVMNFVINTSRVYNAVGVSGNARRAYITARSYAQNRAAFSKPIIHFPLVQDMLAKMRADATAILSGTLHIVKLLDDIELNRPNRQIDDFLRVAINLNKYRSALLARDVIMRAIELLGGNGTIENFSVLPRLLRDNIVYENWEGTHNVLLAQVQRDIRRYDVDQAFLFGIKAMLNSVVEQQFREETLAELEQITAELQEVLGMDELTAAIYFRPLMDRLTDLYYTACLAVEGDWEHKEKEDRTKIRLANLFFNRRVAGREPKDIAYYDDQVSRLCQ